MTVLCRWHCQADVKLQIAPVDPILIKSGYATIDGPDMVPVRTLRAGEPIYYLPGTSLKGVLRSHLERIARTLRPRSVCLPYLDPKKQGKIPVPVSSEEARDGCGFVGRGTENEREEARSTADVYRNSCAACRLFGSLQFAGRISIADAYQSPDQRPVAEQRNGVGIDRFTGGTVPQVLFDQVVLVGGVYETSIRILNFETWQLAALILLLADLQDELIAVGSGRSRGLGRVKGRVMSFRLTYLGQSERLVGLYDLASEEEQVRYGLDSWQPDRPIALAPTARRGLRSEYDLLPAWTDDRLMALVPAFEVFLARPGE